jgi:hypothetical protein
MKMLSTVGPLDSLLGQYDEARELSQRAQEKERDKKWQLIQYAIDQNMLDCLTINVNKLRQYR